MHVCAHIMYICLIDYEQLGTEGDLPGSATTCCPLAIIWCIIPINCRYNLLINPRFIGLINLANELGHHLVVISTPSEHIPKTATVDRRPLRRVFGWPFLSNVSSDVASWEIPCFNEGFNGGFWLDISMEYLW